MKHVLSRFSAVCVATLFLVAVCPEMSAQPAAAATSAKPATPEDLGQSELLKAYLQLREQLHATQLAIANSRAEAEATARTQAAANAEKVEAIRLAIDSERQRQQAERERQQLETQRSNWMVLWIAAAFGGVGLLAVLAMPLIQLRAINKMSELAAGRPTLAAPSTPALLAPEAVGPPEEAVTQSNQRLLSALDRMEKRIMELEQTASSPLPAAAAKPTNGTSATVEVTTVKSLPPNPAPARTASTHASADADHAAWIAVLMNKARSSLKSNNVIEAAACYDEVLKFDPNHSEALVRKGTALERLSRFEAAIEAYDRAIEVDQKLTLAYLHKAAACNRLGRYQQAVECFEQALQVEEKAAQAVG